jgi:hypothetical protein
MSLRDIITPEGSPHQFVPQEVGEEEDEALDADVEALRSTCVAALWDAYATNPDSMSELDCAWDVY